VSQHELCLPKGDKITNMYISFPLRKYHFHMSKYQFQSKFVEVELKFARGPTRPHEAYEISKSRDFEPDFLISNLISVDF
jgi:hypothetical protein